MSESKRVQTPNGITGLEKTIALFAASDYCKRSGLSYEKLKRQRFIYAGGMAAFVAPNEIKPNGLINDMATVPKPVLILKDQNGELTFEQTEHTKTYLE